MNLTKYFMLRMPEDGTFGPADMPSIWNLNKYTQGMTMNWDGASYDPRTVLTDSALGIVVEPQDDFEENMQWLEEYLRNLPPPKYPFPVDEKLAAAGKPVFERNCAACHASERTGKPVPVEEVGTDRNRLESWNKDAAIAANKTVNRLGVKRTGMVEETLTGYIAVHLDGVWLRAPYLHNGSVPTLRALLTPPGQRPAVFFRGYDLYDRTGVGFVAQGPEAERVGVKFDTTQRANGNQGHDFGTGLSAGEKNALIEYLKTL
jgi:mono/diheme cytochrome c family protein